MGELLSSLLTFLGRLWLIFAIAGGIYISLAGIAADSDLLQLRQIAMGSLSLSKRRQAAEFLDRYSWERLVIVTARHPEESWRAIQVAFPFLSIRNWGPDLLKNPTTVTRWQVEWHIVPPIVTGLVFGFIGEMIVLPVARERLAKRLASGDRTRFGKVKEFPRGDGFVLCRGLRLSREASFRHVLTIAPSGGGKTRGMILPALLQLPDDMSAVVSDPKGELLARCGLWLKSRGHPVLVINPLGVRSHGIDPLKECLSADDARELARQILAASGATAEEGRSDSEWDRMSQSLLAACLVEARARSLGLADAVEAVMRPDVATWIKDEDARFDLQMFLSMSESERTTASVRATIQGALSTWRLSRVAGFLGAEPRLDLHEIRDSRAVVFVVSPASQSRQLAPVLWLFWSRLFTVLGSQAGSRPCMLFLDEFVNIGRLEGISEALNLLRSSSCGLHCVIQNTHQLKAVYGPSIGDLVRASYGTVCVLPGCRDDAEQVARWIGRYDEVRGGYSPHDDQMRASFGSQQRDSLAADRIRQLNDDEVLVIHTNRPPVLGRLLFWDRVGRLRERVPKACRGPSITASQAQTATALFAPAFSDRKLRVISQPEEQPEKTSLPAMGDLFADAEGEE